jgi:cytochrome c oxidase subunit II
MNSAVYSQAPSVLAPAGAEAAALQALSLVLIAGATLLFAGVTVLLVLALRQREKRAISTAWWILGGGIGFPVVVLSALLLYSTARTAGLERPLADPPLVVGVTGRLWWWEVRYRDPASGHEVMLANELRLPVGRPAQIALGSADVIHSFWVPSVHGKKDLIPGRINRTWLRIDEPGVYRGQCAEFCGLEHARMAITIHADPPDVFAAWLAHQREPAAPPASAQAVRGLQVFTGSPCVLCHTIAGTTAGGRLGPDLTHVASRSTLAAGTLPNTTGNLAGWILDPQHIKPGVRMPATSLAPADYHALLAYLGGLR